MRNYDDLTQALEAINRQWSQGHFTCWIGFRIPREKLPALHTKWLENYGTGLSAPERKNRKRRSLPTAWACVVPVMGMPHQAECVLLASPEALEATVGPFARENWLTRPPEVGDYVMVREPSNRGDYTWTWRIQNRVLGLVESDLTATIKTGDRSAVARKSQRLTAIYPLFGGVRRQLRRTLKSAQKLYVATGLGVWPGPDPERLPAKVGFSRSAKDTRPRTLS